MPIKRRSNVGPTLKQLLEARWNSPGLGNFHRKAKWAHFEGQVFTYPEYFIEKKKKRRSIK